LANKVADWLECVWLYYVSEKSGEEIANFLEDDSISKINRNINLGSRLLRETFINNQRPSLFVNKLIGEEETISSEVIEHDEEVNELLFIANQYFRFENALFELDIPRRINYLEKAIAELHLKHGDKANTDHVINNFLKEKQQNLENLLLLQVNGLGEALIILLEILTGTKNDAAVPQEINIQEIFEAFSLFHLQGFSVPAIAERLNLSATRIRNYILAGEQLLSEIIMKGSDGFLNDNGIIFSTVFERDFNKRIDPLSISKDPIVDHLIAKAKAATRNIV
jgi:hypothetical protein